MTSRKSLPWYINRTAKTLRPAPAYTVQPVERDAASVVRVPYGGEEERNVSIPIRVTAGSGNRRRWWSGDVHVVEASPDSL
jgi:hypothetical protein